MSQCKEIFDIFSFFTCVCCPSVCLTACIFVQWCGQIIYDLLWPSRLCAHRKIVVRRWQSGWRLFTGAAIWDLGVRQGVHRRCVSYSICVPAQHAYKSFTWLSHSESQSYRPTATRPPLYAAPHDQFACRIAHQNLFLSFLVCIKSAPFVFVCLFAIPAEVFQINIAACVAGFLFSAFF